MSREKDREIDKDDEARGEGLEGKISTQFHNAFIYVWGTIAQLNFRSLLLLLTQRDMRKAR